MADLSVWRHADFENICFQNNRLFLCPRRPCSLKWWCTTGHQSMSVPGCVLQDAWLCVGWLGCVEGHPCWCLWRYCKPYINNNSNFRLILIWFYSAGVTAHWTLVTTAIPSRWHNSLKLTLQASQFALLTSVPCQGHGGAPRHRLLKRITCLADCIHIYQNGIDPE